MIQSKMLTYLYTVFLALMIALFVGSGVNAFYTAPPKPEFPIELQVPGKTPASEQLKQQQIYNTKTEKYHKDLATYNRNTALISTGLAVVLFVASFFAESRIRLLANSILLGGVFTLTNGIIRAIISGQNGYTFFMVAIGLMISLYFGYYWFVRKPRRRIPVKYTE